MYIRRTKRKNKDGSTVVYVQLCHNHWDSDAGYSKTKIIYSFGREDELDPELLERLVDSIKRYLHPDEAQFKTDDIGKTAEFIFEFAKRYGGTYVLDQLWQLLDLNSIIGKMLKDRNFAIDIERLIFTMVANRALNPSSKLAIEDWVKDNVFIPGLDNVKAHNLYRAMDFLLEAKDELEKQVFNSVAHLLNLEVDLIYFDTTSTYFEVQPDEVDDEEFRKLGYSKDKRPDLLQAVIGLAVTKEGIPIKSWVWPGNTSDMSVVEEVKDDLVGWKLGRVISVMDRGFTSDSNMKYLQRAGGHYIVGEKLRSAKKEVQEAMARSGRYQKVKDNLQVKEVTVGDGPSRKRYILAYNPKEAKRQKETRDQIISDIKEQLKSLKQVSGKAHTKTMCNLRSHKVYGRYIRQLKDGRLKLNKMQIREDTKYDGKYLMLTSDDMMPAEDVALGYKQLVDIENAFRTLKQDLSIRPVYHRLEDRIKAHVMLNWLALLLVRIAENKTNLSWKKLRHQLNKIQVGKFIFNSGEVYQTSKLDNKQLNILNMMGIKRPPRYPEIKTKS